MRFVRVAVNAEQLLYPSPGGIGRYTTHLLTVLPELFPDVEVHPFTARHNAADLRAAGLDPARTAVQALPRPVLYDGWHRFSKPALRGLADVDVVHAPSVAVPPKGHKPLVVTVHDAAPELFPEAFPRRGRTFHRLGMIATAHRADLVITVSQAAAAEIVAHSDIPQDRIRVVPNGVLAPPPDPAATADLREKRGLGERPFVLWVGSLEPRKGVDTLLEAMAALPPGRADTVLAGFEGWLAARPASAERLGESLHELGRVSEAVLWGLYAGATIFAFPSRHEGFGLPVIEAMSQGTPVVAADIPAIREVAGDAAVLVPPDRPDQWAEAIAALLADERERDRLAAAGRARARIFDLRSTCAATRAVYREVGS